jgi:hypothetical protein
MSILTHPATAVARKPVKPPSSRRVEAAPTFLGTIAIGGRPYDVERLPACAGVSHAYRLVKADEVAYDVHADAHGCHCTCGDHTFRHEGKDDRGCKHIQSLRSLGMLPWPAATAPAPGAHVPDEFDDQPAHAPASRPERRMPSDPVDGAWELGFELGCDGEDAAPWPTWSDDERAAFLAGWEAGRDEAMREAPAEGDRDDAREPADDWPEAERVAVAGHRAYAAGGR